MNSNAALPGTRAFSFYCFPKARRNTIAEILWGLRQPQKTINSKFFYDQRGSQLYELITKTFDYYVTRTESEILRRYAAAIAATVPTDADIIEPGSGDCNKIEYLLEALRPNLYIPIDISANTLKAACSRLTSRYGWLNCFGIAAEFNQLNRLEDLLPNNRRVIFFPGSTIGNLEPEAAIPFLRRLRKLARPEGGILIGVDNVKNATLLERAYNDREGITAAFNKNVLLHLNRIASANFDPTAFDHLAFLNREKSRIEMHLVSRREQTVNVAGEVISFRSGETIHTENSYKYTRAAFRALAAEAGLRCVETWHDDRDYFTLYYLITDPQTNINEYNSEIFYGDMWVS